MTALAPTFLAAFLALSASALADDIRATGDLGLIVEREAGSLLLVDQSERKALARIEGLGDLSHASMVFSPMNVSPMSSGAMAG